MKNNNQKIIQVLSKRGRKQNKMRNLFAMIAIILTSLLFSGTFTMTAGIVKSVEYDTMRQVGTNAHAGFKNLTREQYEKIKKDKRIREGGYDIFLGMAENPELASRLVELRYSQPKAFEGTMMKLKEGHLPKEKKEIVVDTFTLDTLGLPYKLGEELLITYTVNGKKVTDSFRLSGYYEGDLLAMASEAYFSKEYVEEVLSVLSEAQWKEKCDMGETNGIGLINYNVTYRNSWNIEKKTQQIIKDCGLEGENIDYGINWAYSSTRLSRLDAGSVCMIVAVLLIILCAGYLMIYNIFYLSIVNDIRFYGLLKTIGTTQKQIKKLIRKQADGICLYAIPLGVIAGWLLGNAFMPLLLFGISDRLSGNTGFAGSPFVFVFGVLFSYFTVRISCHKPGKIAASISPIEAAKYQETRVQHNKKTSSKQFSYLNMAKKNLGRNRKKTAFVIASMSLGMTLLIVVYTVVASFSTEKYVDQMLGGAGLYLSSASLQANNTLEEMEETLNCFDENIPAGKGVESTRLQVGTCDMALSGKALERYEAEYEKGTIQARVDEQDVYTKERIEAARDGEEGLEAVIYGWDAVALKNLTMKEGTFDVSKYESGDYVVLEQSEEGDECAFNLASILYQVGDTITIQGKKYQVMALVELPFRLSKMSFSYNSLILFLPPEEMGKRVEEVTTYGAVYSSEDQEEIEKLEQYAEQYTKSVDKSIVLVSKQSLMKEFQSLEQLILVVGGTLCIFIGLIAIMNYVNSVATGIFSRRKEFAMMKSIGMERRQLLKMLYWESGIYLVLSCLIAGIGASIISWYGLRGFCQSMTWLIYHYTLMPLLLCLPLLFFIGWAVPYMAYRNYEKHSVVELLREE